MGYTAAFEPAMVSANARHAHMEMGDVPILDHGAYVMLGNDELFLQMLAEGAHPDEFRDLIGWTLHATKAMGVKVVNTFVGGDGTDVLGTSTNMPRVAPAGAFSRVSIAKVSPVPARWIIMKPPPPILPANG